MPPCNTLSNLPIHQPYAPKETNLTVLHILVPTVSAYTCTIIAAAVLCRTLESSTPMMTRQYRSLRTLRAISVDFGLHHVMELIAMVDPG